MKAIESTIGKEKLTYQCKNDYINFIVNNEKYCPYDLQVRDIEEDINWIYSKANLENPKFIFIAKSYLEEKLFINYVLTNEFEEYYQLEAIQTKNKKENTPLHEKATYALFYVGFSVINPLFPIFCTIDYAKEKSRKKRLKKFLKNDITTNSEYKITDFSYNGLTHLKKNDIEEEIKRCIIDMRESAVDDWAREIVEKTVEDQISNKITDILENSTKNSLRYIMQDLPYGWKKEQKQFVEQKFGIPWNSWLSLYPYYEKMKMIKGNDFCRYYSFLIKGIWSVQFFEDWCVVTQMPRKICRDDENKLHNQDGPAIIWRENKEKEIEKIVIKNNVNYKIADYFIHGIYFSNSERELWKALITGKISSSQIASQMRNMERRQLLLSLFPIEDIIKQLDGELISSYYLDRLDKSKCLSKPYSKEEYLYIKLKYQPVNLYKLSGQKLRIADQVAYILHYHDPSTTREYFDFIDPDILLPYSDNLAKRAMAWKLGLTLDEYINDLEVET